ncbi:similar to Saccharomyces cerevisiae YNL094W APP1 Protein of unknown function, interacts with Rvs161p and Rvs167p [Maudiozyma saulgeensis]|uniref:Phosphatidate phosphatase APP1 catalytic domain-containing protein n=1 Tax=Maudiozyma saulgeensis TaxID=1789683 RepID=A0A1X7QYT5_9SACH|nr:similar to Saccharomyces cerevisiae YNL094W APP1 Protein of unknown function, interacts with Rvs161p and Rvs167p [Kazachstania saulgeensis]
MANWRSLYRLRRRIKMEQLSKQRWFSNPDSKIIPLDTSILFYPTYTCSTIETTKQDYLTRIRLLIAAPGNENSRKNKIILSLCRQYLKEQSTITQSRLNGFLSRSIPTSKLIVDLINHNNIVTDTKFLNTDPRGLLTTTLRSSDIPDAIRITLDTPSSFPHLVSNVYPSHYIKPNGIGVISDIDDTIKHTGVTGDKKSMFKNVFVTPWEDWIIEGIPKWFNSMASQYNVDFFYVSNSPFQLYPTLQNYISKTLPNGPIFLKQYAGNIFASIMNTSSANSKKSTIEQILNDFPQKKFLLIGDSGEKDFETYVDIALRYPEQIIAIYIRCCKDSISDGSYNDVAMVQELNKTIAKQYMKPFQPPTIPNKPTIVLSDSQKESIRISKERVPPPPPPPLPKRPSTISSMTSSLSSSSASFTGLDSDSHERPLSSRERHSNNDAYVMPSTQNDYNTYDEYFDKKADSWKLRLNIGLRQLINLPNFNIDIQFFIDPTTCMTNSMKLIRTRK